MSKKYTYRDLAPGGISKTSMAVQGLVGGDPQLKALLRPAVKAGRQPAEEADQQDEGDEGLEDKGSLTSGQAGMRVGRPRTRKKEWADLDYDSIAEYVPKLARARRDIAYFIENFLYIVDKSGMFVPFKLWHEQKVIVAKAQEMYDKNKPIRLWIVKPRQIGSSTVCAALVFWLSVFHDTYNCRVVAHKKDASTNIFKHIRRFRDNFPFECMLLPAEKSKTSVSFDTDLMLRIARNDIPAIDPDKPPKANVAAASRIGIEVVSETMGRSDTVQVLWCSEFAHWVRGGKDLAPDAFGASRQTVPLAPETAIIIESTANGTGGMFHDGFWEAMRGESEYEALFFPWYEHHEYYIPASRILNDDGTTVNPDPVPDNSQQITAEDLRGYDADEKMLAALPGINRGHLIWRRWAIHDLCHNDPEFFKQEYPATAKEAFIVKGVHVFDPQSLELIEQASKTHPPLLVGDFYLGEALPTAVVRGPLKIWKQPDPKDTYCIGADVAQGVRHGDYSVAYVRSLTTGEYVAKYRRRVDIDLFTNALFRLGRLYNDAKLGVEANPAGGGVYVNRKLLELGYGNLFFTHHVATLGQEVTDRPGWYTHSENREMMIQTLTSAVKRGIIRLYDALEPDGGDFVAEARQFSRDEKTGKAQAKSKHDDCVLAACITEMVALRTPLRVETKPAASLPWITKYIDKFKKSIGAKEDEQTDDGLELWW